MPHHFVATVPAVSWLTVTSPYHAPSIGNRSQPLGASLFVVLYSMRRRRSCRAGAVAQWLALQLGQVDFDCRVAQALPRRRCALLRLMAVRSSPQPSLVHEPAETHALHTALNEEMKNQRHPTSASAWVSTSGIPVWSSALEILDMTNAWLIQSLTTSRSLLP